MIPPDHTEDEVGDVLWPPAAADGESGHQGFTQLFPRARCFSTRTLAYFQHPLAVWGVLASLFAAQVGNQLTTAPLAAEFPVLQIDLHFARRDIATLYFGAYTARLIGKLLAGILSDIFGGRVVLLVAAVGASVAVMSFSFVTGLPSAVVLWSVNGLFSMGISWVAIVNVTSKWVPSDYAGRFMAIVGLSPLIGDAFTKAYIGLLLSVPTESGMILSWRMIMRIAAATALGLAMPLLFMRRTPQVEGITDTVDLPEDSMPIRQLLLSLMSQKMTWALGLFSGTLYGIRVYLTVYSPKLFAYLLVLRTGVDEDEMSPVDLQKAMRFANPLATVFSLAGCVSILAVGFARDKFSASWLRCRAVVALLFALPLIAALCGLWSMARTASLTLPTAVALTALAGFGTCGPYRLIVGSIAVSIAYELHGTTAALGLMGVFDTVAALALLSTEFYALSHHLQWTRVFLLLSIYAVLAGLACVYMIIVDLSTTHHHEATTDYSSSWILGAPIDDAAYAHRVIGDGDVPYVSLPNHTGAAGNSPLRTRVAVTDAFDDDTRLRERIMTAHSLNWKFGTMQGCD